jgi:hypothetical protein
MDSVIVDIVQPDTTAQQFAPIVGSQAVFAERRPSSHAGHTVAANRQERKHNVVANGQIVNARAKFDYFTGCFMTQHHWHLTRPVSVDDRQVRMAKPGGSDLYQHFTSLRCLEVYVFDCKRLAASVWALSAHLV